MNTKIGGGPAFPNGGVSKVSQITGKVLENFQGSQGMSLRDYFAARAMVGILSQASERTWPSDTPEALAQCAYQTADAMLAERIKS